MNTSVHQMPMTRNVGCTKGVDRQMEASGFNPSRGPGCVLHALRIISHQVQASEPAHRRPDMSRFEFVGKLLSGTSVCFLPTNANV
jgi:hypothetical protein